MQKGVTAVAYDVVSIYNTASIPVIDTKSIINRIKKLIDKVKGLAKYLSSKKTSINYQDSLKSLQTLFDICTCKCVDSGIQENSQFICPLSHKIPPTEWSFWLDQKTERKMYIGAIDIKATGMLQKKEMRAVKRLKFERNQKIKYETKTNYIYNNMSDDADDDGGEDVELQLNMGDEVLDHEISSGESDDGVAAPRNIKKYPELCKALDRCKISNRCLSFSECSPKRYESIVSRNCNRSCKT